MSEGNNGGAVEEPKEQVQVDENQKLTKIKVGDKEVEVVNTVTMIEIVVHKLVTGQEIQQVIAHDFMMADHKVYMVKMLTDAINVVMRAKKAKPLISMVSKAMMNKYFNNRPRMKDKFRRR